MFVVGKATFSPTRLASPSDIQCTWPPQVVSRTRDLDFTECFEYALLLPVPLVFALLVGTAQVLIISRRLKHDTVSGGIPWVTRSVAGERICRIKLVRTQCCR